jgi:hypothetical protein
VQIWGSSMSPKYHPKDIVIINPMAPPRPFGGVLAMNEDRSDVCIGEFVSETDNEWIIARFGSGARGSPFGAQGLPDHPRNRRGLDRSRINLNCGRGAGYEVSEAEAIRSPTLPAWTVVG